MGFQRIALSHMITSLRLLIKIILVGTTFCALLTMRKVLRFPPLRFGKELKENSASWRKNSLKCFDWHTTDGVFCWTIWSKCTFAAASPTRCFSMRLGAPSLYVCRCRSASIQAFMQIIGMRQSTRPGVCHFSPTLLPMASVLLPRRLQSYIITCGALISLHGKNCKEVLLWFRASSPNPILNTGPVLNAFPRHALPCLANAFANNTL